MPRRRPLVRAFAAQRAATAETLERLRERVDEQAAEIRALWSQVEGTWEMADLHARIRATMEWIALADVPRDLLVSVITPTRNRSAMLGRAIDSVLEQSYPNWELIVIDDGSSDDTPGVLATQVDPRIRCLRTEGVGSSPARNRALDAARGEYIVYLDDDDALHPDWLRAVAWAADRHGAAVMYGAILGEYAGPNDAPAELRARGPVFALAAFDREALLRGNLAGGGQLTHRRDLPEARWDESLEVAADWDLLIRLTRDAPALALPAIATAVTRGGAADRLTNHPDHEMECERIRARHAPGVEIEP